jgi:hypothetical protein
MKPHHLIVEIHLGRAVFDDNPSGEVARILGELVNALKRDGMDCVLDGADLFDKNGDVVGTCIIEEE